MSKKKNNDDDFLERHLFAVGLLIVLVVAGLIWFFGTMKGEWDMAVTARSYLAQQRVAQQRVDDVNGHRQSSAGTYYQYDPHFKPKPMEAVGPDGKVYQPK